MESNPEGRSPPPAWERWDYARWSATLASAKAGDHAAMDRLEAFLFRWMGRHLSRQKVSNEQDREDIIVDAVAHVMRDGLAHVPDAGPDGWERWLMVVLAHVATDWWRTEKVHRQRETPEADMPPHRDGTAWRLDDAAADDATIEDMLLRYLDAATVRPLLDRLKAPDRRLLEMRFWEGLTTTEIANRSSRPRGTVARRLHELFLLMKGWLTEDEI